MIGGVFLVLMGVTMLRKLRCIDKEVALGDKAGIKDNARPILLGMTTTLSNPYWFGWWGTVGASLLVASSASGTKGIVAFVGGHISSDLAWYTVVSCLVSAGLSYSKGSWYKVTFAICGVFLMVVGGLFIRYGLRLSA